MTIEQGAIYRDIENGGLHEVQQTVNPRDQFDPQNASIPLENMATETWFSIFYDIFRSDYRRVADSREGLDEEQRTKIAGTSD